MKLFIGLGNPGEKYQNTRHNIGAMSLTYAWKHLTMNEKLKSKFDSLYGEIRIGTEKCLFIFPQTFMNNSGLSVRKWMQFYDLEVEDMYVFYDDMDIPFSTFRLKIGGSAGGHNGLKSIISHVGAQDFNRVRIGIDRPTGSIVDYVLGSFSKHQLQILSEETFPDILRFVEKLPQASFMQLMNTYNQKK